MATPARAPLPLGFRPGRVASLPPHPLCTLGRVSQQSTSVEAWQGSGVTCVSPVTWPRRSCRTSVDRKPTKECMWGQPCVSGCGAPEDWGRAGQWLAHRGLASPLAQWPRGLGEWHRLEGWGRNSSQNKAQRSQNRTSQEWSRDWPPGSSPSTHTCAHTHASLQSTLPCTHTDVHTRTRPLLP